MRERKADRQKNHNFVDDVPDNGPPIASDLSLEEEVCMYVCMYVWISMHVFTKVEYLYISTHA